MAAKGSSPSFPPSFNSFPELDFTPSKSQQVSPNPVPDSDKKKKRRQDGKERKHRHDKLRSHEPEPSSRVRSGGYDEGHLDDERLKAEEDRRSKDAHEPSSSLSQPLFYSDKKGDPLNVRYGGLSSSDVPKYHLVGCAFTIFHLIDG
jgi:hypothetical protein